MSLASRRSEFDVVTFGETMILFAPGEREKLEFAPAYHASIGGAESNCAIGLARLGHSVCWVSRLGADPFGSRVLKTLRGEEIDVSRVEVSASEPTGITPALSDANRTLTFELVDLFRAAGTKVVFDPNMRFRLWTADQARPVFLALAKNCDILVPSLAEAEILTGCTDPNPMLDALQEMGPSQIILKAGDQGAWYADGAKRGFCPCFPAQEIDPVGAGDAFCAGLISGLLDGCSLPEAVTRGAALGAFCVSTFGDYHGLPDREILEAYLRGKLAPGR